MAEPSETRNLEESASPLIASDFRVLHVYANPWSDAFHVVSQTTVRSAQLEHDAKASASHFETYGELRQAGEIDELEERLRSNYGIDLERYVAAIDRSAGSEVSSGDVTARLAAVSDFDFVGEYDGGVDIPSDDEAFRSELGDEVPAENTFMHRVQSCMQSDIPADLFTEFCTEITPMFSESSIQSVEADRLEALVVALELRGYTVHRDQ